MKISYAACITNLTRQQIVPILDTMEPEADTEFARVRGQVLSYEDVAAWLNGSSR